MKFDKQDSLTDVYAGVIAEHRGWLQRFGEQRLKKWEDLLQSCSEAAICEAETRKLFSDHGFTVEPYEDLSTGGPDFLCSKNSKKFYVEITCITIDVATKKTTLPFLCSQNSNAQYRGSLTDHIFGELCRKTSQCSGLEFPCVVAIATLHPEAGRSCFDKYACEEILKGTSKVAVDTNLQKERSVGNPYQITNLQNSAFVRFTKKDDGTTECARNSISAILLCPFGRYSLKVNGLLHPNPNYPFDRSLLSDIEFAKLADGYQNGSMKVEWL